MFEVFESARKFGGVDSQVEYTDKYFLSILSNIFSLQTACNIIADSFCSDDEKQKSI